MTTIGGETRLRLFPITVTASADRYLVTRRDTGTMLQTSESGVDSIQFLRRGLTIDRTRARLDRWMRRLVDIDGLEHLDRAQAEQRGVILCGFHLAGYSVIPFALASRGYAQLVLMAATADSTREIRARINELREAGFPYPIEPVAAPGSTRRIVRGLNAGAVVVLLADPTPGGPGGCISAPFLGGSLRLPRGVAWLARRASAVVLPVGIQSTAPGRYRLQISSPIGAADRCTERTMIEMLATRLEREVLDRPAAWLKWQDLHLMAGNSGQERPGGSS